MTALHLTPPSLSWPTRLVSGGLEIVDDQLEKASLYAEQLNHALRPIPKQTELIDFVDDPDLRLSVSARLIETFREQIRKGLPVTVSTQNAAAIVNALLSDFTGGLDDRQMLLEYVLVFLSRLPPNSRLSKDLSDKVITLLYNDLPHPTSALVGPKYRFRSADGSGNNIYKPDMGKAGSHYARSVQDRHPLPLTELPSASLVFDALLKRETQVEHPAGISSHFFAFANLVIHSLFHTDHSQGSEAINKTSSYLDLSIIYGSNQDQQDSVRLFDGTGRIHPDTFADARLLQMPPSTPALCVLFSRNHNYITGKLLAINERGRWNRKVEDLEEVAKKKQDEEIFQTSRLINCGWFMNTILSDYLSAILGLVREGNSWTLDPLQTFRDQNHKTSERGQGNVVSTEFTALYHFHASISAADEQWAAEAISRMFPGRSFDDISVEDYTEKIKEFASRTSTPPNSWTFGGLTREEDGSFPDDGLAKILQDATVQPAGAFGARRTPHALKIVEIMSIEHNREWGTCTLNAFRSFLGLKPYKTFDEWNPRPDIADAARRLYGHPDNLELYVGLQAEDTKPPIPGAGLCPGYTTSRAILADAVALVRGDRYLTNDYTAFNLTTWGITDAKRNPKNAAFGGMLPDLLIRTLPNHYDPKSVYTQFPLMTPASMKKYLGAINLAHKYSFDRPLTLPPLRPIKSAYDVRAALASPSLHSLIPSLARDIFPGLTYLTTFNRPDLHRDYRNLLYQAFAGSTNSLHTKFIAKLSAQLIQSKSYAVAGLGKNFVDIVKDVIQPLGVHFASHFVLGIPLKTKTRPHGTYYDGQLHHKLKSIYDYIFALNPSASAVSTLDEARKVAAELGQHVRRHFRAIEGGPIPFANLFDKAVHVVTGLPHASHDFLSRLLKRKKDRDDLAFDAVVLAALLAVELPKVLTNVVDVLLSDAFRPRVMSLALSSVDTSLATLKEVVLEAIRLAPSVPGVIREASSNTLINGKLIHKGDHVFVSLVDAAYDPCFKKPDHIITPSRGKDLVSDGLARLLGPDWIAEAALPVIKNIFSLGGLSRSPGGLGHLSALKDELPGGTKFRQYLDGSQQITNSPSKLLLDYTSNALSPTSISTARPSCTPSPVDWSPTSNNALDGPNSKETPVQSGSSIPGGDATGSTSPPAGTGVVEQAQQSPSPDYQPEFIGGVGGGAKDPDYDYQNPYGETSIDQSDGGKGSGESSEDGQEDFKIWKPDLPPRKLPTTTQLTPGDEQEVFKTWKPDLPPRKDPSKVTNPEDTSVTPNEPKPSDPGVRPSGHDEPKDPGTGNAAASQSSTQPSDNGKQPVQTEKDQGATSADPKENGDSQKSSGSAPAQNQDLGKIKTPPPEPEHSNQPEEPVDETPFHPQNEPSGFSHTAPAGNLRRGTPWDDYSFPPDPSQATITVVKVHHDAEGLRAIRVSYSSKWAPQHGASQPTSYREDNLYLQRGEKIVRVEGRESDKMVTSMQLFTSTGRQSNLFGSTTVGKPFLWEGNVLRYFSGNEDSTAGVTALRGHFT
ncbi:hypothetical protein FRC04_005324 [Tulasnella sp. 424]|nr:hypothetical protein FRC04_005324 [Tulasnella sp. 424]KAG8976434.1 hypothetical protein FRC05_003677 [Tulasnella sp. 425]